MWVQDIDAGLISIITFTTNRYVMFSMLVTFAVCLDKNFIQELSEMKKSLLMLLTVFVCSACASSEPKIDIRDVNLDNAVTENGEKLYCKRETITGSHMKTTTCLTKAQKEMAERDSEEYVNRLKRTPEFRSSEPNG